MVVTSALYDKISVSTSPVIGTGTVLGLVDGMFVNELLWTLFNLRIIR